GFNVMPTDDASSHNRCSMEVLHRWAPRRLARLWLQCFGNSIAELPGLNFLSTGGVRPRRIGRPIPAFRLKID
ncbi:MAG TPA: hypothetical protein VMB70_09370, partial [Terriglobia bacterium]|nr:hypothetical protein [Terriglobia bacterium]